jgi:CPA1 family monovalent cation:H+ antiporter
LDVAHSRLKQFVADGRVSREARTVLHARHEYRVGRLPVTTEDGIESPPVTTKLRTELITAEREYIYRLLQDGQITDEARRRIERELDLEEASVACKQEGGEEPPL